jgi:hypothetical protein
MTLKGNILRNQNKRDQDPVRTKLQKIAAARKALPFLSDKTRTLSGRDEDISEKRSVQR